MENIKKELTCCFTGHRPQKLTISESEVKRLLCNAIQNAVNSGYVNFITGMAPGVDVWAGEILLEFQNIYPHIRIICALPYPSFCASRVSECKKISDASCFTHIACNSYTPFSFQWRNIWMVDHSSMVLAVFNGDSGGTKNTLAYAKNQGVKIINILKEEQ